MNRSIIDEQSGWGREDSVAFFESSRHGPGSLYLSERLVLPRIARDCTSVLDIGCAAGGFVSVFRHFNDRVRYTGVDAVHSLLRAGAAANPGADFVRNDGANLPFATGTHDLVWSSGILHLNSAYEAIVRDAWRVAKRWLICDFRLAQDGQMHVGAFDVDFGSGRSTAAPLPYIVLPRDRLLDFLASLQPTPGSIVIKGYAHPVSPQARDVPAEVIMAFVVVEKGGGGAAPRISVDIRSREAFAATLDTSLDTHDDS